MKSKPLPPLRNQEKRERDLSVPAHEDNVVTTGTNPAYEMVNQVGGGGGEGGGDGGGKQESHEYEVVDVSQGTEAADETYEMPSPPSCQPLPTIPLSVAPPTGGDVGVVEEREEESTYYNIPGH